ncbi:hypothetical protein ABPG73_012663 [Tetrahymena malaccensis]
MGRISKSAESKAQNKKIKPLNSQRCDPKRENNIDQSDQNELNRFLNQNLSQNLVEKEQKQKKTRKDTLKKKSYLQPNKISEQKGDINDMEDKSYLKKKQRKKKQNTCDDNLHNQQQIINQNLDQPQFDGNTFLKQGEIELNTKKVKQQSNRNKRKKIEYDLNDRESHVKEEYGISDLITVLSELEKDQVFKLCKDIFPHENPYPNQIASMKKIIETLENKQNLLFQSPTGTGKTLMTICSALSYVENNPNTKILLLTRTCEQINGFIKEIRKIKKYEGINQFAILAGRNQFCPKYNQIKKFFQEQKIDIKISNDGINKFCNLITEGQQEEDEEADQKEEEKENEEADIKIKQNQNINYVIKILNVLGILDQNQNVLDIENFKYILQLFKQTLDVQKSETKTKTKNNDQTSKEFEKDKIIQDEKESIKVKSQNTLNFNNKIQIEQDVGILDQKQNSHVQQAEAENENYNQSSIQIEKDESIQDKKEIIKVNNQNNLNIKDGIQIEKVEGILDHEIEKDERIQDQKESIIVKNTLNFNHEIQIEHTVGILDQSQNSHAQLAEAENENNNLISRQIDKDESIQDKIENFQVKSQNNLNTKHEIQIEKAVGLQDQNAQNTEDFINKLQLFSLAQTFLKSETETKNNQNNDQTSRDFVKDETIQDQAKIQDNSNIEQQMQIEKVQGVLDQNQNGQDAENHTNKLQLFKETQIVQQASTENNQNHDQITKEIEKDESEHDEKEKNNFYLLKGTKEVEIDDIAYNPDNEQLDYCEHYKLYSQNIPKQQNINWSYPKVKKNTQQDFMLPDIEDINLLFQDKQLGCPYFYNKEAAKSAKIIYSTYNYVIKQHILNHVKCFFEKSNLIVIFDEGHNISELAEQELKVTLNKDHWDRFYESVKKLNSYFQKYKLNDEDNVQLKQLITNEIENEAQYFKTLIQRKNKPQEQQNSQEQKKIQQFHLIKEKMFKKQEREESENKTLKQKNFSYTDPYDQMKSFIYHKQIVTHRDDLKALLEFIQKDEFEEQRSNEQILDQNLETYKRVRDEELFSFLKTFQSKFLYIGEFCENNFISWFDPKNNKNQNFSELFYCQNIYSYLQKLELFDIQQMKDFINKSQEIFINLKFIEGLIKNEVKQKKIVQINLLDVSKNITVDTFLAINKFFKKLLYLRNLQEMDNKNQILLDYYLCFQKDNESFQFQIGCLSAQQIFKKIKEKINVHSFIFTSGTLEPFELTTKSICLEFQTYAAENTFNSKENLFTQIVTEYQEKEIHFNYDKKELIITNAISAIKDILNIFLTHTIKLNKKQGFLIFFKNYSYLNQYYKEIKNIASKQFYVYKETNNSQEFKENFQKYKQNIENNYKNCIFLCVCKGKLSEGIDMKDDLCRIVILLGVPYPQLFDPYVNCQRKRYKLKFSINDWYEKVTSKVVNQAAGRCIRHINDWGCIFFLDKNFSDSKIKKNISSWILGGQKQIEEEEGQIISNNWQNLYKAFLLKITNKIALKSYQN